MADSSFKGLLTSKVGGVPVAVIGVLGIGGLAWYLSKKSPASDSTPDPANGPASSGLDASTNPLPTISNTYINVTQPGGTATTPTSPSTGGTVPSHPIFRPPHDFPIGGKTPLPVKTGGSPPKQTSKTYVVKSGDNLTKIAKSLGIPLAALESANKSIITSTAKKHGYTTNFYHWIFPGEKLVVPA